MIDLKIKWKGAKVKLRGVGMRKLQNLRLLEVGLGAVKDRLSRGQDASDAPAEPLTKRYAIRKSKLTGGRAIRNLSLTGKFLRDFRSRYADDDRAVAYSSGRDGRIKAILYRDLIDFSPEDQRKMGREAERIFRDQVSQISTAGGRFKRQFSR